MNFRMAARHLAILLFLCLFGQGCLPPGTTGLDEEKDPHFLMGRDRVNKLDYKGAIESFEKALDTNPKSASAHFELALLFEQKEPNPARAIYHFERYLDLRPSSDRADIVKQKIAGCKQELAKSVTIAPGSPSLQREMEKLKAEIERLMVENTQLRQRLDATARTPATSPNPVSSAPRPAGPTTTTTAPQPFPRAGAPAMSSTAPTPSTPKSPPPAATPKSHTIKPGETPSAIARMYGVKLEKLMSANPNLDPKKLRPGQTLVIPAP